MSPPEDAYLIRLKTNSDVPPTDEARVHFSSSDVKETMFRVCTVPVQFGYVLPSTFIVTTLPATVYVPNSPTLPFSA
jgi:hypothetical protein